MNNKKNFLMSDVEFWLARPGTTQLRILEALCAACLSAADGTDLAIVDLYSRIRCDEFGSLSDLANHQRRASFLSTLQNALEEENLSLDEETRFHARGVVENFATLVAEK